MHYNEFVHHLFLHKDLDEYLIKYKKFIVTNFQRLIRENILVSFNNIDYVFNYYDDFYYKFFIAKIINEENSTDWRSDANGFKSNFCRRYPD